MFWALAQHQAPSLVLEAQGESYAHSSLPGTWNTVPSHLHLQLSCDLLPIWSPGVLPASPLSQVIHYTLHSHVWDVTYPQDHKLHGSQNPYISFYWIPKVGRTWMSWLAYWTEPIGRKGTSWSRQISMPKAREPHGSNSWAQLATDKGCLAPCFALRRNQGLLEMKSDHFTYIYSPLFIAPCHSASSSGDFVDKIKSHKVGSILLVTKVRQDLNPLLGKRFSLHPKNTVCALLRSQSPIDYVRNRVWRYLTVNFVA